MQVNEEQRKAGDKFLDFMLSDRKYFHIFGTAGTGKSYLVKYLKNEIFPKLETANKLLGKNLFHYDVYFTATTHKACAELEAKIKSETRTIYSMFSLVVNNDYFSGETYLSSNSSLIYKDALIFIDECSMLSDDVLDIIDARTVDSKIVFIGDPWQLPPVKGKTSWPKKESETVCILTQQMRSKNADLQTLVEELKNNVISHRPVHLCCSSPSFYRLDSRTMQENLACDFRRRLNCKILSFTNKLCMEYQEWLNNKLGRTSIYSANTVLLANNAIQDFSESQIIVYPDMEVSIAAYERMPNKDRYPFLTRDVTIGPICRNGVWRCIVAENPLDRLFWMKKYAKEKNWGKYFQIKDHVLDLRYGDAITIHKAQGSTYDTVYLDLDSFSTCPSLDMAMRLLYVAVSRAREKVILYGDLPTRFGVIYD